MISNSPATTPHATIPTVTSWFRDPHAMAALFREVEERDTELRIVSAGCSSGEEAYSTLFTLWRFRDKVQIEGKFDSGVADRSTI